MEGILYRMRVDCLDEILQNYVTYRTLSSDAFAGRGTGNNQKAQELITGYFKELGLKNFKGDYSSPFTFIDEKTKKQRKGINLIGYVEGKTEPNKFLVIGAHYDHMGVVDGTIYNGADDNASGTSALLVLAKYFTKHQPGHSIIFAAFDAEELGLHGSKSFVAKPPVPLSDIKLNFNFDMMYVLYKYLFTCISFKTCEKLLYYFASFN